MCQVESETAQSMQTLVELDAVKQRMLESQRALKEADNWTTLLADVDEVFASQDIDKVRLIPRRDLLSLSPSAKFLSNFRGESAN